MKRRSLLQAGLQSWLFLPLIGHTPFPQWKVYRQRHLFIAIDRTDAAAYRLSHEIAAIFDRDLPEAEAKVTRAVDAAGVASLISTGQLDVALIRKAEAVAWMQGAEAFQAIEPVSLRALVDLGNYLLVCRSDFPDRHAAVIAHTLAHALTKHPTAPSPTRVIADPVQAIEDIPLHPGVF